MVIDKHVLIKKHVVVIVYNTCYGLSRTLDINKQNSYTFWTDENVTLPSMFKQIDTSKT
jgi:hypothetical protein